LNTLEPTYSAHCVERNGGKTFSIHITVNEKVNIFTIDYLNPLQTNHVINATPAGSVIQRGSVCPH